MVTFGEHSDPKTKCCICTYFQGAIRSFSLGLCPLPLQVLQVLQGHQVHQVHRRPLVLPLVPVGAAEVSGALWSVAAAPQAMQFFSASVGNHLEIYQGCDLDWQMSKLETNKLSLLYIYVNRYITMHDKHFKVISWNLSTKLYVHAEWTKIFTQAQQRLLLKVLRNGSSTVKTNLERSCKYCHMTYIMQFHEAISALWLSQVYVKLWNLPSS